MKLGLLLVALACLGAACAQFPPLPASCVGTVSSFTALLGAQTEIDAACPKGATSCSEACKAALAKYASKSGEPVACLRDALKLSPTTTAAQITALETGFKACGLTATASPSPSPQPSPSPSPAPKSLSPSPSPTAQPQPSPSPVAQPSPSPSPNPSPIAQPQPSPSPAAQPSPSPSPSPSPIPDVPTLVPWEAVAVGAPPSAAAPAPAPAVAKELTAAPAPAPEVAAFDDAGKAPALSTGAQPATQDDKADKASSSATSLAARLAVGFAAVAGAALLA